MRVPQRRPFNEKLKTVLSDALALPVDMVLVPTKADGTFHDPPYVVIFPAEGGHNSGPLLCGHFEDTEYYYYIHSVGKIDFQAEALADRVRQILLEQENGSFVTNLDYDGFVVMDRTLVGSPGKLEREGTVFSTLDTYSFTVTPG